MNNTLTFTSGTQELDYIITTQKQERCCKQLFKHRELRDDCFYQLLITRENLFNEQIRLNK